MQKILLVDDDVDIIESYRGVLEHAGYEVRFAHDGASGFGRTGVAQEPGQGLPDAHQRHLARSHDPLAALQAVKY